MKKFTKNIFSLLLCASMVFSPTISEVYAASSPAMTELPGTQKVEKDYDETFLSVTGFAEGLVQDRSRYYDEYVANGYKNTANYMVVDEDYYKDRNGNQISAETYAGLSKEEKTSYTIVTSEEQFCRAMSQARVVEIRADLELGYKYLEKNNIPTCGIISPVTDYEKGFEPITSPVLMERGVSDIAVSNHMTIFSPNGSKIEHAGFHLNKVEDVVIRNLAFQGLYEWDDVPEGVDSPAPGGSKRYGWCYMSCNNARGIWIDHCDFGYAFDGNIDLKNDSQVSVTWSRIGYQDTQTGPYTGTKDDYNYGCDLWKCILYMEEQYQAGNGFRIYKIFRDNGATMKQIFNYACLHHKVHLVGPGENDYQTNPLNAITLAYNQYKSVGSRIPKIRQGNGHMFNCYLDDEEYQNNCYADKTFNKARSAVSEAGYSTNGISRGLDASCGATIGVDTCVFNGFRQAMKMSEITDSGRFKNAVNYQLIVNSSYRQYGSTETYIGSSWDNNGDNIFNTGFTKSSSGSYITSKTWKWSEWKPMTKVQSEAVDGVAYVPESLIDKLTAGEFYKQYYIGRDNLGYAYQTFKLEDVKKNTDLYSGAGKITLTNSGEWTKLYYGSNTGHLVQFYDDNFEGKKSISYEDNEVIGELPVPKKSGYIFQGWYEGTYQDTEDGYKLVYSDTPVTEQTKVSKDMNLYAKWKIISYILSFNSMGGTEVEPRTDVPFGTTISAIGGLPANVVREGYKFLGWYQYNAETKTYGAKAYDSTRVNGDTTLYAKWQPETVDIIFDSRGGSTVETIKGAPYGKTVTLPEAPQKGNATFLGWYYDEALTKEFKETTKVTERLSESVNEERTLTLYAKWEGGNEPEKTDLKGDIDGNGKVEAEDALMVLKYVANMIKKDEFTDLQKWQADADGNEKIEAEDALMILKYVANMISHIF